MTDVRQLLNRILEECLNTHQITRNQMKDSLPEIGSCFDRESGWHVRDLRDGRLCVGMQRSEFLYVIDPQETSTDPIKSVHMDCDTIPIKDVDKSKFDQIVEKYRSTF